MRFLYSLHELMHWTVLLGQPHGRVFQFSFGYLPIGMVWEGNSARLAILGYRTGRVQTRIANAVIYVDYEDGTRDSILLVPPFNYCPIEQDYFVDGKAFNLKLGSAGGSQTCERPVRVSLSSDVVSSHIGDAMGVPATEVYGRLLDGDAAQILSMPLNNKKKVSKLTMRCLSNDIVVGIMAITLLR